MSDNSGANPASAPDAPAGQATDAEASLRTMAMICYVLFLLAPFNGITAIVGVIVAYVKKSDAGDTIWRSHFENMILVFWIMVAAFAVAVVTFPVAIGIFLAGHFVWSALSWLTLPFIILPILAVWSLYRVIRGLVHATESRAY